MKNLINISYTFKYSKAVEVEDFRRFLEDENISNTLKITYEGRTKYWEVFVTLTQIQFAKVRRYFGA